VLPRVLVADDEDALRRVVARLLSARGFEVVQAKDGLEAVEALKQGGFDAVLTDLWMPGIGGIDVLRRVREFDLVVPVLIMSAAPNVQAAVDALRFGATDFISKPVDHEELVRKVRRGVDLHRLALAKQEALRELGSVGSITDRAGLEVTFERALGSLTMAYQPIVDVEARTTIGYEALMRGDEPALSTPLAILAAADRLGRLHDVGRRVRELVPTSAAEAPADSLLFLNLHAVDLMDSALFDASAPLAAIAARVVFEITERASLDHVGDARAVTARLRGMGYRIAIDDLGAGYAGLSSFAQLEPDFVKLDMSLVRDIDKSPVRQKLVQKMTALCKDMGTTIIAEGIETDGERDVVVSLGCRFLQGYRFARPGAPFPAPRF
jgi:EAL domain-containing protein (putative c-di-GMP-specific phosphodiesterase class I)